MKKALIFFAVVGLAASLGAQSVADLAKREKERREGLKGRHAAVIKNADLLQVKKLPAVEVVDPGATVSETDMGEGQAVEPEIVSSDAEPANLPSGSGAPTGHRIVPSVSPNGPLITGDLDRDKADGRGPLEAQLKSANDLVDLLTTKMNALRQQFEFQDAMVPGSVIQGQIDETNQRLVKAQSQQARIQAEMEKKGLTKK